MKKRAPILQARELDSSLFCRHFLQRQEIHNLLLFIHFEKFHSERNSFSTNSLWFKCILCYIKSPIWGKAWPLWRNILTAAQKASLPFEKRRKENGGHNKLESYGRSLLQVNFYCFRLKFCEFSLQYDSRWKRSFDKWIFYPPWPWHS